MYLSRNYRLIVAPRKFDLLKTNICPRSVASNSSNCLFIFYKPACSRTSTIYTTIFLGRAQWADSVSPRINTTMSRDQFKPMRIAENLVVNYCIIRDMRVIIVFIRRAQEPTLENIVVDLWQDLPASLKILALLLCLVK